MGEERESEIVIIITSKCFVKNNPLSGEERKETARSLEENPTDALSCSPLNRSYSEYKSGISSIDTIQPNQSQYNAKNYLLLTFDTGKHYRQKKDQTDCVSRWGFLSLSLLVNAFAYWKTERRRGEWCWRRLSRTKECWATTRLDSRRNVCRLYSSAWKTATLKILSTTDGNKWCSYFVSYQMWKDS